MNGWQILLLLVGCFVFGVWIYSLAQAKHPMKSAFFGVLRGWLALGAVNLCGVLFTHITLPISIFSLCWSACTGIPGVITMLVLEHFH